MSVHTTIIGDEIPLRRYRMKTRLARGNSPFALRLTKRDDKGAGQAVADLIRQLQEGSADEDNVCELLNNGSIPSGTHPTLIARFEKELSDDFYELAFKCGDCGEYKNKDRDRGHSTDHDSLCDACADNDYNWSECMGTYIHQDHVRYVYYSVHAQQNHTSDDVCTDRYGARNLHEYDGDYVDGETYNFLTEEFSDEDGSENRAQQDGLHSYHGSYRNWVEDNSTPLIPALGVEIEVYSEEREETVSSVKSTAPGNWYFESDGSLSDDYGFEIISQPHGPNEWKRLAKDVLDDLNSTGAVAYTHPDKDNNYGIHINIHRRHLSPLQEARMLLFMFAKNNEQFMQCIAQRAKIYGGGAIQMGSYSGSVCKPTAYVGGLKESRQLSTGEIVRKPAGHGKYSPINMRDNIAEIRIFQSTLHLPSFMKNLEFTWALIEWTSTKAATGSTWQHEDFVRWLGDGRANEGRYPNLFAYLRKPSYTIKHFDGRIINTWAKLLPKQTTKSLDVVAGNADQRLAA